MVGFIMSRAWIRGPSEVPSNLPESVTVEGGMERKCINMLFQWTGRAQILASQKEKEGEAS